jgi:PAS domain-containing protein
MTVDSDRSGRTRDSWTSWPVHGVALEAAILGSRNELNWFSTNFIDVLPAAVYVCNSSAVIVAFNQRATELWGRTQT